MKDQQNIEMLKMSFCCSEEWSNRQADDQMGRNRLKRWQPFLLALLLLSTIACRSSKKGSGDDPAPHLSKLIIVSNGINSDSLNTSLVKGVIVDEQGEGLLGADVKVDKVSSGIIADLDGHFEIQFSNVALNAKTLSVQYVGYEDFSFELAEVKNKEVKIVMFQNLRIGGELVATKPSFRKRVWSRIKRLFQ